MIQELLHLSDTATDALLAVVGVACLVGAAYWMGYFKRGNSVR
ncbi:hypothetical protein [Paraburkholderia sp. UYCP14C]|nr:hypothetical protein [Paraburkholderia sp. UYCP14C]